MAGKELVNLTLNLDSPEATVAASELIRSKKILHSIYLEHYRFFYEQLEGIPTGTVVELGSGGGFIKEVLPNVVTSDVVTLPTTDMTFRAEELPFPSESVAAILMINVFHHIQDVRTFLRRAQDCLTPNGIIAMVEPANTPFSRLIYSNFHHEPFEPDQEDWSLPPGGRMSSANDALPWIVFKRDRVKFDEWFPSLRIESVREAEPFRYILSGGLSRPQLCPSMLYPLVRALEWTLRPLNPFLGMFMKIRVRKTPLK